MDRQSALDTALRALERLPEPIGGKPDIGSVVWERLDSTADCERRGGMVVDPPENGTVLCVQIGVRRGRKTLHAVRLRLDELDPNLAQPANRAAMASRAVDICAALGAKDSKRWSDEEKRWLDRARDLIDES